MDCMTSLPLHPLVVHAAVMLMVLVPLLVVVSIFWRNLRERLDWMLPLGAVGAFVAAVAASQTGKSLLQALKQPTALAGAHAELGEKGPWVAAVYALATVGWWLTTSKVMATWVEARQPWLRRGRIPMVASILEIVASIVIVVVVVLIGDSGATAVWTNR